MKSGDIAFITYRTLSTVNGIRFRFRVLTFDGEFENFESPSFNASTATWAPTTGLGFKIPYTGWLVSVISLTSSSLIPAGTWFQITFGISGDPTVDTPYGVIADFSSQALEFNWLPGKPNRGAFYDPLVPKRRYTFQGSAYNGAGGAGTCSILAQPLAGGRLRVHGGIFNIDDITTRVVSIVVRDSTGGNIVDTVNAATSEAQALSLPFYRLVANSSTGQRGPLEVAGNTADFFISVGAVALSKGVIFGLQLDVDGGAPTITLAATNTPTLTTNTSRFEAG